LALLSRPLRELPPPFLWAISTPPRLIPNITEDH